MDWVSGIDCQWKVAKTLIVHTSSLWCSPRLYLIGTRMTSIILSVHFPARSSRWHIWMVETSSWLSSAILPGQLVATVDAHQLPELRKPQSTRPDGSSCTDSTDRYHWDVTTCNKCTLSDDDTRAKYFFFFSSEEGSRGFGGGPLHQGDRHRVCQGEEGRRHRGTEHQILKRYINSRFWADLNVETKLYLIKR